MISLIGSLLRIYHWLSPRSPQFFQAQARTWSEAGDDEAQAGNGC